MENKMQIGIPKAMSFYSYYPFWYGFFDDLGIKIVLSDATTKKTLSEGASLVVSETCLPIKVYAGHVLNLINKGVKKIFVPSIQSVAPKIYNCSKIRGLPDIIRNVIKADFEIIEATFDKSEPNHGLYDFLKEIAKQFDITDFEIIKRAARNGQKVSNNYRLMTNMGVPYSKALKLALQNKVELPSQVKEYPITVAVIAHGYNLYDERVSMRILDKLENMNVGTKTAEQLTENQMSDGITSLGSKVYWANEYEITGAASHYIQDQNIDGIIIINAFGCGPDSLMVERISRYAKEKSKPFLNLSIDEQTGEAGFVTRIEAFTDMLLRKKTIYKKKNLNDLGNDGSISLEIMNGIKNAL
jgi:predicted nucleotide-binding protein (sugar kinase/HSP70/actin superfamily)